MSQTHLVGSLTALLLLVAGLTHVYWAIGGTALKGAAIPEVQGRPAFVPSTPATVAVALALLVAAGLVAAQAGILGPAVPEGLALWGCRVLALVFLARGVGDFRLVGLFKKANASRFARWDTWLYSPLCLFLGLGCAAIAVHGGGP